MFLYRGKPGNGPRTNKDKVGSYLLQSSCDLVSRVLTFLRFPYVFPVPRLIKVRTEAEALSVAHQPLVNKRLDLNRAGLSLSYQPDRRPCAFSWIDS